MAGINADMVILTGNSHKEFAKLIAERLGVRLGACSIYHSSNRETVAEIGDSVRGRDVYIVQTGAKDVNNVVMESLILAYACKTSSAKNIVGVFPYMPYSKQSKMRKRGCIAAKLMAKLFCKSGFTHIITMDLHQKEVQGFFDIPVDNLRASPFLLQYIQESIPDYRNAVIVAKDPGLTKKATSYAERLRLGIAVIHGEQKVSDSDQIDGRSSPPPHNNLSTSPSASSSSLESRIIDVRLDIIPSLAEKNKPPMTVVGDVMGRIAIIVDDLIDDVAAFVAAAEVLKDRGAYKIYVLATHGLLSQDAPRLIEESPINEVVVTNTVPHEVQKLQCAKIKTVDISILISEAIRLFLGYAKKPNCSKLKNLKQSNKLILLSITIDSTEYSIFEHHHITLFSDQFANVMDEFRANNYM
ncbi:phosphoribosyl pyrophosphate synthase-associated protein 2-like protein [Dermatophagoides farinae]|uniref:Phosphoribosyl pyrophosphate synthase-associated protein 2-like protein n=1 Tax=Dermatophagoides farinae TaxID=6954 RepID=A0A9D4NZ67_DERFA|nr:phosphoribosyl pyrophosphate synthase-associated protein 2-like protein [Dermatophagoides farinae]